MLTLPGMPWRNLTSPPRNSSVVSGLINSSSFSLPALCTYVCGLIPRERARRVHARNIRAHGEHSTLQSFGERLSCLTEKCPERLLVQRPANGAKNFLQIHMSSSHVYRYLRLWVGVARWHARVQKGAGLTQIVNH